MENQQHDTELDNVGGERFEGSGFENEEPIAKDEVVFTISPDQHKGEAS